MCSAARAVVGAGAWAVLKLGAVSWNWFDCKANKALPSATQPREHLEVQAGDMLLSRKNTRELVGASALVDRVAPRQMFPDLMFRLRPTTLIDRHYLWSALQTSDAREQIRQRASGSAASMCNVSQRRLREVRVALPPLELQERFGALAAGIAQRRMTEEAESGLSTLVVSLRSQLFNWDDRRARPVATSC